MKYEIRVAYHDDHDSSMMHTRVSETFTNKRDALWHLRRFYALAYIALVRVEDGKQIAHRDGLQDYNGKVIIDERR